MTSTKHAHPVLLSLLTIVALVLVLGYYAVGVVGMVQGLLDIFHPVVVGLVIVLALLFRAWPFVFSAGLFWGAYAVWEWPWWGAALMALPSLALWALVVVFLGSITTVEALRGRFKKWTG